MKAESEGRRHPPAKRPACRRPGAGRWAGKAECRSGERLGSGIRAQPLGCRGLRQLWRHRERRQIVESEVTVRREPRRTGFVFRRLRQTLYGGWLGNLVEREEVIKFLTVRNLTGGRCARPMQNAEWESAVNPAFSMFFRQIAYRGLGAARGLW